MGNSTDGISDESDSIFPTPPSRPIEIKPGYKTTEFWIVVFAMLASNAQILAHMLDPKWGAIVMAVGSLAYAISRGLAKQ